MTNFSDITIIMILVIYAGMSLIFWNLRTKTIILGVRFILDNLPNRQMSIDADLNAGFIDEVESSKRRALLTKDVAVDNENNSIANILTIIFKFLVFVMAIEVIINLFIVGFEDILWWTFIVFGLFLIASIFIAIRLIKRSPYVEEEPKQSPTEDELKSRINNIQENMSKQDYTTKINDLLKIDN